MLLSNFAGVGIKSFSITRLKPIDKVLENGINIIKGWNQKFLDYEIETRILCNAWMVLVSELESKVSRLRD